MAPKFWAALGVTASILWKQNKTTCDSPQERACSPPPRLSMGPTLRWGHYKVPLLLLSSKARKLSFCLSLPYARLFLRCNHSLSERLGFNLNHCSEPMDSPKAAVSARPKEKGGHEHWKNGNFFRSRARQVNQLYLQHYIRLGLSTNSPVLFWTIQGIDKEKKVSRQCFPRFPLNLYLQKKPFDFQTEELFFMGKCVCRGGVVWGSFFFFLNSALF